MNGPASRLHSAGRVLGGLLLCGFFGAGNAALAQTSGAAQGRSRSPGQGRDGGTAGATDSAKGGAKGGAQARRGQAQDPPRAGVKRQREPSAAYQESLRRTVEKRRERRARRAQGQADARAAIGAIVPWPMPPALIIRHTPDVHAEVGSLLDGLRR
jgi:hypothetical protein